MFYQSLLWWPLPPLFAGRVESQSSGLRSDVLRVALGIMGLLMATARPLSLNSALIAPEVQNTLFKPEAF
jgi:hypothetical protein